MARSAFEKSRGAAWRIWDLHVHTPSSIVQGYGGDTDDAWSKFLDDLESLPAEISVIGINDYWFLDGYKRVLEARKNGRVQNLDAIFPVVEMRLDQFGGTESHLSRVNMHVIFDPDLDPAVIEAQFLNALQPKFHLSPEHQNLRWQGVITKESLAHLGEQIKASVPEAELGKYDSDLTEGFNNLNVSLSDVKEILDGQFFHGKALLGIGKTEWSDIKWTGQSIATKKNVINSASLVFTAFKDTARWKSDVERLRASNVTHRLLDCSDAHYFSDSDQHMRLGACQTWMNTTPTFAGLTYALEEFDRRVFVGLEPPSLARVRKNPERFMTRVTVKSDKEDHVLFDHEIPLNSGFVAVVGNKGQGKSALLDCIALAGNSSRNNEFAFLTTARFLSPTSSKRAKEYYTELEWATGSTRRAKLTDEHDRSAPVSVEYLPQAFVERVCNLDPATEDADEFETELRTVLFTHISEEERADEKSFDALLAQKTRVSQDVIDRLRADLGTTVADYSSVASFRADNQLPEVQARLALKQKEVDAAKESLQDEQGALGQIDAASSNDGKLTELRQRSEQIESTRGNLIAARNENQQRQAQIRHALAEMEALAKRAEALQEDAVRLNAQAEALLSGGKDSEPFVSLTINRDRYETWRLNQDSTIETLRAQHEVLSRDLENQDEERRENAEALAAADSARERARQRVLQSEERVAALIGSKDELDSLTGLEALCQQIIEAPDKMNRLRTALIEKSKQIHEAIRAQLDAVRSLYAPASDFIAKAEVVKNAGLEFNAELRLLPTWRSVSTALDGRRNGSFADWLNEMPQRVEDASWDQIAPQLQEALVRLEHERAETSEPFRNPANALRSTTTLPDFLVDLLDLSWLELRFGLTGDGLPLSQLSPGQRGLVLALFYLVVDRRTTPLLLDQPEENLDNETIASKLVPAIHEAAGRRQTIVVTHNANLAVVGDADQIIHCQHRDNRFQVDSGSIAELDVAQFALNVLEGTKVAFDNRRHKYEAFPELI